MKVQDVHWEEEEGWGGVRSWCKVWSDLSEHYPSERTSLMAETKVERRKNKVGMEDLKRSPVRYANREDLGH